MKLQLDYSNFKYDDKDHIYTFGNIKLVNVTEILSIISDHSYVKQKDLDRGKYIHKSCWMFLKGNLDFDKLDPEIQKNILVWSNFLLNYKLLNVEIIAETPLYSAKYYYAGTPDYIFFMDSKIIIVDIKSGSEYKSDLYQLIAYKNLIVENFKIDKSIVLYNLYLKTGKVKERIFTKKLFNNFLSIKATYGIKLDI